MPVLCQTRSGCYPYFIYHHLFPLLLSHRFVKTEGKCHAMLSIHLGWLGHLELCLFFLFLFLSWLTVAGLHAIATALLPTGYLSYVLYKLVLFGNPLVGVSSGFSYKRARCDVRPGLAAPHGPFRDAPGTLQFSPSDHFSVALISRPFSL